LILRGNVFSEHILVCFEIIVAASESERTSLIGKRLGMHDMLRPINMDDSAEGLSDNAGGLGNMPELTRLLEDDEVVKKFSVSLVVVN